MIHKAYRDGFWKPIARRKAKEERLGNVYYLYRFMKRIRGNREVFTKKLSSVEEAEQARVAAVRTIFLCVNWLWNIFCYIAYIPTI
jgi:hypothetical protein